MAVRGSSMLLRAPVKTLSPIEYDVIGSILAHAQRWMEHDLGVCCVGVCRRAGLVVLLCRYVRVCRNHRAGLD